MQDKHYYDQFPAQPLFGKGACTPPLNSLLREGKPDTREWRKSSLKRYACMINIR